MLLVLIIDGYSCVSLTNANGQMCFNRLMLILLNFVRLLTLLYLTESCLSRVFNVWPFYRWLYCVCFFFESIVCSDVPPVSLLISVWILFIVRVDSLSSIFCLIYYAFTSVRHLERRWCLVCRFVMLRSEVTLRPVVVCMVWYYVPWWYV